MKKKDIKKVKDFIIEFNKRDSMVKLKYTLNDSFFIEFYYIINDPFIDCDKYKNSLGYLYLSKEGHNFIMDNLGDLNIKWRADWNSFNIF